MYYFKYNDTNIEKYVVQYNREELINLKYHIISDCKELVHREFDSKEELKRNQNIINLKVKKSGDTYHYSYDEYVYPKLVSLIDMILRNNDKAIDEIKHHSEDDIISLKNESKQIKLRDYYNRINNCLSYELLVIITLNEHKNEKIRSKRRVKTR